jgi:DNA-binding CsgD family transcriptional regulator
MERLGVATAPREHSRRRGDLVESPLLHSLIGFLLARPDCDGVAQHLVLGVLREHHARSAVISRFGNDGQLETAGSFGIPRDFQERLRAISLWDAAPMSESVRSGDPVILGTRAAALERYPDYETDLGENEAMIVWPLSLPGERVGAIQVTLASSHDLHALIGEFGGCAAMLGLYVNLLLGGGSRTGLEAAGGALAVAMPRPAETGMTTDAAAKHLTSRQLVILEMMALQLTNPEISRRVGFSESTVRHETMAVYRSLGVDGRRQAVKVAVEIGLLNLDGSIATELRVQS